MGALYTLKTAADEPAAEESSPEESHRLRNLAMAGAAATPFAGMIGQQPIIHDPHLNPNVRRFKTMDHLQRQARPGDVILTSKPKGSIWKNLIAPVTGSDFYHVQEVVGRRRGKATTSTAGQFFNDQSMKPEVPTRGKLPTIGDYTNEHGYPDVLLLRPKKPMSPDELKVFQKQVMQRSARMYNDDRAVSTWLRDVFMPKLKGREQAAPRPVCEGDVCSTAPAAGYRAAGRTVVPGKRPEEVFPSDYLRSKNFKAVGARLGSGNRWSDTTRRAVPLLTRAGLGVGMAGGTYLASQHPEAAGALAGAGAGVALANRFFRDTGDPRYPLASTFGYVANLDWAKGKERMDIYKSLAKKFVPGVAAGYLGYKGVGAIRDYLGRRSATPLPPSGGAAPESYASVR